MRPGTLSKGLSPTNSGKAGRNKFPPGCSPFWEVYAAVRNWLRAAVTAQCDGRTWIRIRPAARLVAVQRFHPEIFVQAKGHESKRRTSAIPCRSAQFSGKTYQRMTRCPKTALNESFSTFKLFLLSTLLGEPPNGLSKPR